MILAPSEIHFLKDASTGLLNPDPGTMADLAQRFQVGKERIPKVQVASKDGLWFALNNSYLHILRDLQKQGKCTQVCVEVVPLTKVPESVQEGMVVGKEDYNIWADGMTRQVTSKTLGRLSTNCENEDTESSPTTYSEQNTQRDTFSQSQTCQAYQRNEKDRYRLSADCNTALLEALDSETDGSSYSSTDYSDYYNDDDEDDDDEDVGDTDSEYENELTCNVCEQGFRSTRLLSIHRQKKRHFGCSVCKANFKSHPALEAHKDELEHWSQEEETDSDDYDSNDNDSLEGGETSGDQEPDELKSLL